MCALDVANGGARSQEDVARLMGLARTTISKIESAAIAKLAAAQGVEVAAVLKVLSSWSSLAGNHSEETTGETCDGVAGAWEAWLERSETQGVGTAADLLEALGDSGVADAEYFARLLLSRGQRAGLIAKGRGDTWIIVSAEVSNDSRD